jgi:hypothetical protein
MITSIIISPLLNISEIVLSIWVQFAPVVVEMDGS